MVFNCVVYQCKNRQSKTGKENNLSFFRFPKNTRKRNAWIKAVNRADWMPNEYSRICSEHFVEGYHSDDPEDINYRPTIFKYKEKTVPEGEIWRTARLAKRTLFKEVKENEIKVKKIEEANLASSLLMHSYAANSTSYESAEDSCLIHYDDQDICLSDTNIHLTSDEGVQCDIDPLLEENLFLRKENERLRTELQQHKWGVEKIQDNDLKTRFYTGLPTFAMFLWLFNYLQSKAERMQYWTGPETTEIDRDRQRSSSGSLRLIDQFLSVLMRLKLGLFCRDLSDRFNISEGTYSKYFSTWLLLLHKELKYLNPFPSREIVDRTMPECFKLKYPSTRVILDCTEIFIQRASSLTTQSQTFSPYKHHNTVKFLIGITPSGVISFVSEGWGGRVSDRQITKDSGILELLQENDSVMADKGFTIKDLVESKKCSLNIPPFRGSTQQFSTEQVFETQEIAKLRIHVERSIGRMKNFHILDGIMPLSIAPFSTKIVQVCCWLTNFDEPLVK